MNHSAPIREGTPSRPVALAVATVGFVVLGAITLAIFLVPETLNPVNYVLGGITGILTAWMYPWQILDNRTRRHVLTEEGVSYRCGILSRYQIDRPYRNLQAVSVREGSLQRVFGCGDVRVVAQSIQGPVMIASQDLNSICIRSIPDFEEVVQIIREIGRASCRER